MRSRYYLSILTLPIVITVVATLGAICASPSLRFPDTILSFAAVLMLFNLAGAWMIFRPVAQFLRDGSAFEKAKERIRVLPVLCAAWAFFLTLLALAPHHLLTHVVCEDCATNLSPTLVLYPSALTLIFAVILSLYVYSLIGDYAMALREYLSRECHVEFEPGRQRFKGKLILAFTVTSVVPILLVFVNWSVSAESASAAAIQWMMSPLDVTQSQKMLVQMYQMPGIPTFEATNVAALILAGVSVTFMARNLTRPTRVLLKSMHGVGEGQMDVRAPVVSDDEVGDLTVHFNKMVDHVNEREFVRKTFGRFVPEPVADAVLQDRGTLTPQLRETTIVFTDIENFTAISEQLPPEQVLEMLNEYFAVVAEPISRYGGVITQFQGDAILATFNLPIANAGHASNGLRAAAAILDRVNTHRFAGNLELPTRIGVNTGTAVGGIVGNRDRVGYTVHGDAVNVAARLQALNKAHATQILVSACTVALARDTFAFREVGEVAVRGRAAPLTVFELAQGQYSGETRSG